MFPEIAECFLHDRHYNTLEQEALRNWRISGSPDGKSWEVIKDHHNDDSLKTKGGTHTWKLPASLKVTGSGVLVYYLEIILIFVLFFLEQALPLLLFDANG